MGIIRVIPEANSVAYAKTLKEERKISSLEKNWITDDTLI